MTTPPTTHVRAARGPRLATAVVPPLTGALGGLLVGLAVEWWAQRSAGFDGVLGVGTHLGEPFALVVTTALGLTFGLLLAASLREEALQVVVATGRVRMRWGDARVSVPRALVHQVVVGTDIVLLGRGGVELARVPCAVDRAHLVRALARHGYPPASAHEPHEAEFRPWLPGQEAPEGTAVRLLAARHRALEDRAWGDAELLRRQLTSRGVVVRDVRRHGRPATQEWRHLPVGQASEAAAPAAPRGPATAGEAEAARL